MKEKKLTSVKLSDDLFDEFRVLSVRTKVNLQKLAERAMYLYVTNLEFRSQINSQLDVEFTGSQNN